MPILLILIFFYKLPQIIDCPLFLDCQDRQDRHDDEAYFFIPFKFAFLQAKETSHSYSLYLVGSLDLRHLPRNSLPVV